MSITDELREIAAKTECANGRCEKLYRGDLEHIADRIDAALAERYVGLPLDADGVPIHVGERVQLIGNGTVSHMSLADDGWRVYVKYDGGIGTGSGEPKRIRHYHAPTVEDVLRELCAAYMDTPLDDSNDGEFFAEYAEKLRLAGDAE